MRVTDGYLVYAVHTHSVSQSLCVAPITLSVSISPSPPCHRSLNASFDGPVATQAHIHTHYTTYVCALQRDW
ncbi:hypothetical protein CTAM01_09296 [Colletotrichum tamarilloi]|uniref:Uncharacterized protein n=1 Tax=Colletotrichum tamarilloi TaxID=1209934 RepID=A0ABQ9R409_9PEZI|nr:uncharacterized protein CTAM01_09296 [Colletotrichum tamarilloi]KAK1493835.1 hypothetical protein CTAM01_09296 [Colletotrichum tamarilloi]